MIEAGRFHNRARRLQPMPLKTTSILKASGTKLSIVGDSALHREAIMHLEKRRVEAILVRVFEFRGVRVHKLR
jgi:hypothetical protein